MNFRQSQSPWLGQALSCFVDWHAVTHQPLKINEQRLTETVLRGRGSKDTDRNTRNNSPPWSLEFSWKLKTYTYRKTVKYNNGVKRSGNWAGGYVNA